MLTSFGNPVQRRWLVALLVLWAGLLFGGFLFGTTDFNTGQRIPIWARIGSSLILVVAAWSWCGFTRSSRALVFSSLIALGMTLGLVGDLFLAKLLPISQPVLGGIGAFGCGHLAYLGALLSLSARARLTAPALRWGALAASWLIGVVGWCCIVFPSSQPAPLRWAALPYTLLLASTAGLATGLALQARVFAPLALGAALFFFSDLILAAQLFREASIPLIGSAVWLTYGPGQMLIVYSVGSAAVLAEERSAKCSQG
jgi:hypothetical protein